MPEGYEAWGLDVIEWERGWVLRRRTPISSLTWMT